MKTIYLIWVLFLKSDAKSQDKSKLRILGGKDASIEEFPYVVRLEIRMINRKKEINYHNLCTGTTITPTWTVTAAHCIDRYNSKIPSLQDQVRKNITVDGIIRYGDVKISAFDAHSVSQILQYIVHPGFRMLNVNNDVGLLQTKPIQLARYGSISYIDYSTLIGEEALGVGFGLTNKADPHSDTLTLLKPLQIIKVMVNKCEGTQMYPALCIVGLCGEITSMCSGDSGGPLLHSSGLIGVNSKASSLDCIPFLTRGKSVAFITPISPYVEWIKEIISRY